VSVFNSKPWTCPFFVYSDKGEVHCEGGIMRYPEMSAHIEYANRYCAGEWKGCTVARNLLLYYDSQEDE